MKDLTNTSNELVAQIFADYHQSVFFYIYKKIGKKEDAEDLVQDAYLRLLEYRAMLRPDTVKYFLFTIVRNLVSDYFRHLYRKQEASVGRMWSGPAGCGCRYPCRCTRLAEARTDEGKMSSLPASENLCHESF